MISYDSSRVSLTYFCLAGLDLLGTLNDSTTPDQRRKWADWLYQHLLVGPTGFRGSPTHAIDRTQEGIKDNCKIAIDTYDGANVAATYFALLSLAVLRDDRIAAKVNAPKLAAHLARCQHTTGTFAGAFAPNYDEQNKTPLGEPDSRVTYMAMSVLHLLGQTTVADRAAAAQFIVASQTYEGGLALLPGAEAHAGYTYCGLGTLRLLEKEEINKNVELLDVNRMRGWLLRRQIWPTDPLTIGQLRDLEELDENAPHHWPLDSQGAFSGRTNKQADTCYCFWGVGSLLALDKLVMGMGVGMGMGIAETTALSQFNVQAATHFLLEEVQAEITGGFARAQGTHPDPYHSFLALAALSLINGQELGLTPLVAELCLCTETTNFIQSLYQV
ncbi:uncharacterized protein SAPINGB_P005041 [Magnusiomyces paraingens]|uniref:Prenyltransferase alpha-alpha toroid domain-containing protein n=1 Tax=Magnusiomyces paraingens TaxID=2606893 RepID=A0A5E8BY49_9ASCO|nr:uncharacterized protein SAPINGB_P005041 [Saprochaete ingens]VVT56404.1 unnamed protein product [Saprochaete ingens]